jgi:uncharacterized membrane protein
MDDRPAAAAGWGSCQEAGKVPCHKPSFPAVDGIVPPHIIFLLLSLWLAFAFATLAFALAIIALAVALRTLLLVIPP